MLNLLSRMAEQGEDCAYDEVDDMIAEAGGDGVLGGNADEDEPGGPSRLEGAEAAEAVNGKDIGQDAPRRSRGRGGGRYRRRKP